MLLKRKIYDSAFNIKAVELISHPLKRAVFNFHKTKNIIFREKIKQFIEPKKNMRFNLFES